MTARASPGPGWPAWLRRQLRPRWLFGRALTYVFLIVSSFIMIYPVLFVALGAFTTNLRISETKFLPIPNLWSWERLGWALDQVSDAYWVTLLRVGFYIAITTLTSVLGGYVFSKLKFPGRNKMFLLMLMGMVMPAILMVVPQFIQMARWPLVGGNDWLGQGGHGFINDWRILFAYGWVPPFGIFLMKQTFDMLPTDYEEAAKLEGAGFFAIITQVYGPLLKPALAALTIFTFMAMWNDYLWPNLTIYGDSAWYPIAFKVVESTQARPSSTSFLQILMALWPPVFVYFRLQRYFVQGLVASGIRG
jgi:multiple sugar transport system permease protein